MDSNLNFGALPCALRRAMCSKFPDFDAYQLAKYNKEKSRAAKNNLLTDTKHIRSQLKDSDGNELPKGQGLIEDRYLKTISQQGGLKINERIKFELVIMEECKSVKFDLIFRENAVKRRSQPFVLPQEKTVDEFLETVALRLTLDLEHKRIVQKHYVNKVWTKNCVVVNNLKGSPFFQLENFC